uniref:Uncharacterized protein n=1 Tax=Oryza sativa subsp. japonica TaxID=39947 RepID=Q69K70_ORYSJ|nr:hypothetical protein [Oryza sativa Japonica Group]BAD36631.1 hypothetical protein [Oryza sativa Japonica Group]
MASGNNDRHGMSSATTSRIGLRSQDEWGVCGGADRGLRQDLRRWLDVAASGSRRRTGTCSVVADVLLRGHGAAARRAGLRVPGQPDG